MKRLLILLYDWLEKHKILMYLSLTALVILCAIGAAGIRLEEDISSFFDQKDEKNSILFENFRIKDKIIVTITGEDPDTMVHAAEVFTGAIRSGDGAELIAEIEEGVDREQIFRSTEFIYRFLPIFLEEEDYVRITSRLDRDSIGQAVSSSYDLLTSAAGLATADLITRDPLGIATPLFHLFEAFSPDLKYEIYSDRIFSADMKTLFLFLDPAFGMGDTGKNDRLVRLLENASAQTEELNVHLDFIGGPVLAVYNARRIKKDTTITLSIALLVIMVILLLSFRNRKSIPLILLPPIFGALSGLALTRLILGSMSAIALGAGTVILGISLSYSIHVVSHRNFTDDPRQIISELAYPLTLGCLTTIGAFLALLFTSSALLQDLGLFAALALIGTTFFSLVYLPHFIAPLRCDTPGKLLRHIEKWNACAYENKKWIVAAVFAVTLFSLFFYHRVQFDDDLSSINYMPEKTAAAEERIDRIMHSDGQEEIYVLTAAPEIGTAVRNYEALNCNYGQWKKQKKLSDCVTASPFVFSEEEQLQRISRWNSFWQNRKEEVIRRIRAAAAAEGFRSSAFAPFEELLRQEYHPCDYSAETLGQVPVLSEWISSTEHGVLLISRISPEPEFKEEIYREIEASGNATVIDRGFFSSKMVSETRSDFDYILFISSLIVFLALLISYGRIELTLLTFLPMCLSWIILLGFMAIFDIRFNIVNIILATFIFGIGDDFSIFIMDGLLQEYRSGKKLLTVHKTAIFFSAVTTLIGMGALLFAQHPAIRSIGLISVLGMSVVILVSYTVQPFLFRKLVTQQTEKGQFPYTLGSLLNTGYAFLYFLFGCLITQLYILLLAPLPMKREKKRKAVRLLTCHFCRFFLKTMITVRTTIENPYQENFGKPAMVIANHQSFIDILLMLSISPKLILVTNDWVRKSPFFGFIIRYTDFYPVADGYEQLAVKLEGKIRDGYSVVVFPEGSRSPDCTIKRFHKGAFYLAQQLQLDIVPILIYGAGLISAKQQGFYIKHGLVRACIGERVPFGNQEFGTVYQQQAKNWRQQFIRSYETLCDRFSRTANSYFRDALMKNYIYKSPVLEGYMRIKMHLDGYYDRWDRLVPRDGIITDIGCGYGQLSYMLAILSPRRTVMGIDYDSGKIALADHAFLKRDSIRFLCDDMKTCPLPESDAFIFNDSLHYVSTAAQRNILERCAAHLKTKGQIIVRDGDASNKKQHGKTEQTEIWSTRILHFNRKEENLSFVDRHWMQTFAEEHHLTFNAEKYDRKTSETLYILKKEKDEE